MIRLLLPALVLLTSITSLAAQQWERLDEPLGGQIYTLVETDDGLVAGSVERGMVRSTDDGQSWITYGHETIPLVPFGAFSDGWVLVLLGDEGAGRVRLQGDSAIGEQTSDGLDGESVWGGVNDDDVAFVLTSTGFYRSRDVTAGFERLSPVFNTDLDDGIPAIALRGSDTVAFSAEGRLFLSSDTGTTFREVTDSLPLPPISVAFDRSGRLLVGALGNMYVSTDFGQSFESFALQGGIPLFLGTIVELDDGSLIVPVLTGRTFKISADGSQVEEIFLPLYFPVGARRVSSGTIIIPDVGTGIWRSDDDAETFDLTGLSNVVNPQHLVRGPVNEMLVMLPNGFARTFDEGETWSYHRVRLSTVDGFLPESIEFLDSPEDGSVFGIGEGGTVIRWTPATITPIVSEQVLKGGVETFYRGSNGTLIASGFDRGYRSTDGGETWDSIGVRAQDLVEVPDGSILAVVSGSLYRSVDDGITFAPASSQPQGGATSLYAVPGDGILAADGEEHFLSLDNGETWTTIDRPCTGSEFYRISIMGGPQNLGLISDCGVHFYDREIGGWTDASIELPEFERGFASLFLGEQFLVAGGVGGLWRTVRDFPTLSVEATGPRPSRLFLR